MLEIAPSGVPKGLNYHPKAQWTSRSRTGFLGILSACTCLGTHPHGSHLPSPSSSLFIWGWVTCRDPPVRPVHGPRPPDLAAKVRDVKGASATASTSELSSAPKPRCRPRFGRKWGSRAEQPPQQKQGLESPGLETPQLWKGSIFIHHSDPDSSAGCSGMFKP